jgi:hypothetical protein
VVASTYYNKTIEANETTKQAMARNLIKLLDQYDLRKKIVTYVKDEGANLNDMTTLKSMVNCEVLGMEESFQGICFGHAFSKACQYRTDEDFFCKNLKYISIISSQFDLQKYITWPKKSGKRKHEWIKACIDSRNLSKKAKHPCQNKVFFIVTFVLNVIKDLACKFAIFSFFAKH